MARRKNYDVAKTTRLDQELYNKLREKAKKEGVTVSDLIRRGAELVIQLSTPPQADALIPLIILVYAVANYVLLMPLRA